MPAPLTRADLAHMKCNSPDCDHRGHATEGFSLRARCHQDAGLAVAYLTELGALYLTCGTCRAPVALVAVAPGLPS